MKQKIYQIDAFASQLFSGNPAAVCPLDQWLSDELMLKIAAENNLAETAFYLKNEDSYQIRWFTPKVEVDLVDMPHLQLLLYYSTMKITREILSIFIHTEVVN